MSVRVLVNLGLAPVAGVGVVQREPLAANVELRRADPGACHALGPDRIGSDRQVAKRATQVLESDAGVDERTKNHVAGRARETVEVECLQDFQSYSSRTTGDHAQAGIWPASTSE
jgi:hypothetical protein